VTRSGTLAHEPTARHDDHEETMTTKKHMFTKKDPLLSPDDERIVTETIDCGVTVHSELGPGFKERIYERAFCLELESRGLRFECEKRIEVRYKNWLIPGQRIDLIVGGVALVEIKAVPQLKRVHTFQVLSYLKATGFAWDC
jgi:GxxExxY protein